MTPLLAQRARADRSFERIYRRHLGDVYRYSLAVLRNQADAEDVTQTTFLNAYRAFQRGERPRNPQNWLITIAHNVCRQRFRQSQRRPDEVSYDDGIAEVLPYEEPGPTAEDIQRALGHLAFNQRAALVMRELEGRSYAEIAQILEVSVSAVETLLFRARRALREQLEGTLTCVEAERAISLHADGKLKRTERGPLRAHLRECPACARLARSQRAQRSAFKALAAIPIPSSLTSLFGGGGATVGAGISAKAAAFVAAGVVVTGVGYEGAKAVERTRAPEAPARPAAVADGPLVPVASRAAGADAIESRRASVATASARERGAATRERTIPPGQAKKAEAAAAAVKPNKAAKADRKAAAAAAQPKKDRATTRPAAASKPRASAKPAQKPKAAPKPKAKQKAKAPKPKRQPPAKPKEPKPTPPAAEQPPPPSNEKPGKIVEVPQLPVTVPIELP